MTGVFCIRDLKAGAVVSGLMLCRHDAVAVRAFVDVLGNPETIVSKHPEDFDLVLVGTFDEESCELVGSPVTVVLTGGAWAAAQVKS